MRGYKILLSIVLAAAMGGCVERQLTINTTPPEAMVELNDEQIGLSPVTVSFNWYGDYNLRITKEGYQTLRTHRPLKRPWYDRFPFDFFAGCLWPGRKVDSYQWSFSLEESVAPSREDLVENAIELRRRLR
jgi:hypothetical protein